VDHRSCLEEARGWGSLNTRWLIVGHGSVGSFLTSRLSESGATVSVFDPTPRVPVTTGPALADPAGLPSVDYVVSCVPPEVATSVPDLVRTALRPEGMFFDWNTVSPAVKRAIAEQTTAPTIDVALLDSLDGEVDRPNLAVSGPSPQAAARILEAYGFHVVIAGEQAGEAASLKYLRSIFMKGLEALVLEYASLASDFAGEPIVRASLESNLGEQFVRFMDLLITTNRIHAARRSKELQGALETFSSKGVRPAVATASAEVLSSAAQAWNDESAPPVGADIASLARYLRMALWPSTPST
jgi:3-hydroxyisobutyrate dehydrogenase-like beta-hydroxyacid dehydrogenase